MNNKEPVRVSWYIQGTIECPFCYHENDFMDVDEYWEYSQIGENKELFFAPVEVTCNSCNNSYIVNGSDY